MKKLIEMQRQYNNKVYGEKRKTHDELERHTQELALCAHAELSSLVAATSYRKHHKADSRNEIDKTTLLYESVDVIRYVMAIMNLWNIKADDFETAFHEKDIYLNTRRRIDKHGWQGQPVAIVDMDDVITDFRCGFAEWLSENHGIEADVESPEYYFIDALKNSGYNPEKIFEEFVAKRGFRHLKPVERARDFLNKLHEYGYWVHILTARPDDNLACLYDTYAWLDENDIRFDDISFATEKFRWCAQSKYYDSGAIRFAIDDSPKHATEYATHGIKCWVPSKSYNNNLHHEDVEFYDSFKDFLSSLE